VLLAALKEPVWGVRASAAVSLAEYAWTPAAPQVVAALAQALRDEHRVVRYTAARSLEKFGPAAQGAVPALAALLADRDERPIEWPAPPEPLTAEEKETTEQVLKMMSSLRACDAAAEALGAVGPGARPAVYALIEQLKDPKGAAPRTVVRALGGIGPGASAAVPVLVERLKDENLEYHAAAALARMGEPGAAALAAALKDKAHRYTAVQELRRAGKPAAGPLIALLADADLDTRSAAAEALGGLGPRAAAAVPALKAMRARREIGDVEAATKALKSIDPGALR
jgi:HEAT repeat protein